MIPSTILTCYLLSIYGIPNSENMRIEFYNPKTKDTYQYYLTKKEFESESFKMVRIADQFVKESNGGRICE